MSAKKIDDGGLAFPDHPVEHNDYWYDGECGMSLRDWFAGQALVLAGAAAVTESINRNGDIEVRPLIAAMTAYQIADAMIQARKGKQ